MSSAHSSTVALTRLADDARLLRAVPHLPAATLHALVIRAGLEACGELLALVTPAQLSAVFDLDLWSADRAGADERFDPARFGEWLDVLMEMDAPGAAARLAQVDPMLVVAGLAPHITVYDPGTFEPIEERSGADEVQNPGRERGIYVEIGGYMVVARRDDAWDAIVSLLVALDAAHQDAFHRVMRGCQRLSYRGFELDGLDALPPDAEQVLETLSSRRAERRDRQGFLPPLQARAFLESARHLSLNEGPPADDWVFVASQRDQAAMAAEPPVAAAGEAVAAASASPSAIVADAVEILREAGVVTGVGRPRLTAAPNQAAPGQPALQRHLDARGAADDGAWAAADQEVAFLSNVLSSGCAVQGRRFTPQEAMDAVAATCNLGLESWPAAWGDPLRHSLVTAFRAGWAVLHQQLSMAAIADLLEVLGIISTSDRELQLDLGRLRHVLREHQRLQTPWRLNDRIELIATLDLTVWVTLTAVFDECPVLLASIIAPGERPPHSVHQSRFRFVTTRGHVEDVRRYVRALPERLFGA